VPEPIAPTPPVVPPEAPIAPPLPPAPPRPFPPAPPCPSEPAELEPPLPDDPLASAVMGLELQPRMQQIALTNKGTKTVGTGPALRTLGFRGQPPITDA
jgi:hypothetical protein